MRAYVLVLALVLVMAAAASGIECVGRITIMPAAPTSAQEVLAFITTERVPWGVRVESTEVDHGLDKTLCVTLHWVDAGGASSALRSQSGLARSVTVRVSLGRLSPGQYSLEVRNMGALGGTYGNSDMLTVTPAAGSQEPQANPFDSLFDTIRSRVRDNVGMEHWPRPGDIVLPWEHPGAEPEDPGEPSRTAGPEDVRRVVEGNNQFALKLYQALSAEQGNLFFSPYSISTALAMVYAGAEGQTETQMAKTLCFPTSAGALQRPLTEQTFAAAFGQMIRDLNARGGQDTYELRVANALWGQEGFAFLQSFLDLIETQYGGTFEQLDFVHAAEAARQTINTWVEEQTNGKIKDVIPSGMLNELTRLVLTNAIYFKGNWASQFKANRTEDAPFTLVDGSEVQVPMMRQTKEFGYADLDGLQLLEMPYEGKELSMVILLPKAVDGIAELEQMLTVETLGRWLSRLGSQDEVQVTMPKFTMTRQFHLGSVLSSMGMPLAFSPVPGVADFSGMNGKRDLFISAVVHQAYVDVNEEGTEAAAATIGVMDQLSDGRQRPRFCADHPFIFLIRDTASGSILFLGRVMDPR